MHGYYVFNVRLYHKLNSESEHSFVVVTFKLYLWFLYYFSHCSQTSCDCLSCTLGSCATTVIYSTMCSSGGPVLLQGLLVCILLCDHLKQRLS